MMPCFLETKGVGVEWLYHADALPVDVKDVKLTITIFCVFVAYYKN